MNTCCPPPFASQDASSIARFVDQGMTQQACHAELNIADITPIALRINPLGCWPHPDQPECL